MSVLSHWVIFDSCNPMDCSPPGFSVHGISQARILGWVAVSSSRGSSWPRNQTHLSCIFYIAGGIFHGEPPGKPPLQQQCESIFTETFRARFLSTIDILGQMVLWEKGRPVLCVTGCWVASLTSTHEMPLVNLSLQVVTVVNVSRH